MSKELTVEGYKTPVELDPRTPATRQKYMNMYQEYVEDALTLKQLSERHGHDLSHCGKIIKWAVHEIQKMVDPQAFKQIMQDRTKLRIQELREQLKTCKKTRDKATIYREIRLNDRMLAQVQGILNEKKAGDGKVQVNVQINELKRGEGVSKTVEVLDDKE